MALPQRNPSSVWRPVQALVVATLLLQAFQFAVVPVEGRASEKSALQKGALGFDVAAAQNKINLGDHLVPEPGQKVAVSTVAWLTLAMAVATGLGAVPFFFVQLEPRWAGICNGLASGVMLAASFELIEEGQKYGEGSAVVLGIVAGGVFIFLSQRFVHDNFGEVSMLDVKGADVPKMILVVSIMTLHSFGEGSGVGVSFAGPKGFSQGLMVTIAIAVHNIPEGLAVSLLLSNQGLSPKHSLLWSIFTSLPQPLVAVPAFMCAEAFHKFLPLCMGFAGGCMIWMVMAEVLPDSFKDADSKEVAAAATFAVTFMVGLSALLDNTEGTTAVENAKMLLAYLSFGIGPFVGALIHMLLLSSINLPVTMATGIGGGVSFVVAAWKPLQMLLDGKMNIFKIFLLLCAGAFLHFLLRKYVEAKSKTSSKIEIVLPGAAGVLSPMARRACLASFMIWFYSFVEGLAMGVAATSGFHFYFVFLIALHGLPRGVAVGSIVYGATGSRKGSCLAAALTCLAHPVGAISAVFTGVGPNGLESLLVLACGSLFPILTGVLFRRALKVDPKVTYFGISIGIVLTVMCLATTRLVCLHTPYCGTSL
ncbi:hypothetical protein KC19_2G073200 [Ceratodon purpureus]|uniref:Zinc transporter n=1 Tax=Ceratodon purpureus TaxID=3225 RepID=A0A8T0IR42_CERPU|nr:hypothetical protein KC19_2G073200 [Ceratodon purpureus]